MIQRGKNMRRNESHQRPSGPFMQLAQAGEIALNAVIKGEQAKRLNDAIGCRGGDKATGNQ